MKLYEVLASVMGAVLALVAISKFFAHQKPSAYCRKEFDDVVFRVEKLERSSEKMDTSTATMRTEIALLIQGGQDLREALKKQEDTLEKILMRITEFLAKQK